MATKRAVYEIAEFKAVGDPSSGKFKAVVSVFNNVDLQGDRVMPGAFKADLAAWQAKGDPIPVIWSHDWQNPFAHIGAADPNNVRETAKGLEVDGQNDMSDPFAAKVHQLLVDRRVTQWSFAYEVVQEETAKDGANNLLELKIIEVGPTLKGANGLTDTVAAKAAAELESITNPIWSGTPEGLKAGRRISKATEAELQSIHDQLGDAQTRMRGLMGTATADDGAASAQPEPKSLATEVAEAVVAALKAARATEIEATDIPDDPDDREPQAKSSGEDDREPQAKSPNAEDLALRTRIEEMRATLRKT